jgi:hypothetical protein
MSLRDLTRQIFIYKRKVGQSFTFVYLPIAIKLLTSVSRYEEESVEWMEELESIVLILLKEIDPENSLFLTNPILPFNNPSPKGHPSSCINTKAIQSLYIK